MSNGAGPLPLPILPPSRPLGGARDPHALHPLDIVTISRDMRDGIEFQAVHVGGWAMTRAELLKRTTPDAWHLDADGVPVQITLDAAVIVCEDLNAARPWAGKGSDTGK